MSWGQSGAGSPGSDTGSSGLAGQGPRHLGIRRVSADPAAVEEFKKKILESQGLQRSNAAPASR